MTDELLELSIDDLTGSGFLEYERRLTRLIVAAFGMSPPRPLELYIPLVSTTDQGLDVD